jgi:hypothetical protein
VGIDLLRRTSRERHATGQALEQQAAKRVDVGARVHRAVVQLLRGHVVQRAQQLARTGQSRHAGSLLGQTEVGQQRMLVVARSREQHVGGLDVAVHQPAGVCRIERPSQARRP